MLGIWKKIILIELKAKIIKTFRSDKGLYLFFIWFLKMKPIKYALFIYHLVFF